MRKTTLILLLAAVGVSLAATQLTAFYDPLIPDYIIYALDDDGTLYERYPEGYEEKARVPTSGPYDLSACFLPAFEDYEADYSIYIIDASGKLYTVWGSDVEVQATIPGKAPYSLATFYDEEIDDLVILVTDGNGKLYVVWGEEVTEMDVLP
jgi:hypothetical protein